jgi:hypothetical protein
MPTIIHKPAFSSRAQTGRSCLLLRQVIGSAEAIESVAMVRSSLLSYLNCF